VAQTTDALGDGLRVGSVRQPQMPLAPGTELAARADRDTVRAQCRDDVHGGQVEVVARELVERGVPVSARGLTPVGPFKNGPGMIGEPVVVGDVLDGRALPTRVNTVEFY
jgi:hypothetical protein